MRLKLYANAPSAIVLLLLTTGCAARALSPTGNLPSAISGSADKSIFSVDDCGPRPHSIVYVCSLGGDSPFHLIALYN